MDLCFQMLIAEMHSLYILNYLEFPNSNMSCSEAIILSSWLCLVAKSSRPTEIINSGGIRASPFIFIDRVINMHSVSEM